MDAGVDAVIACDSLHQFVIPDFTIVKRNAGRNRCAMAARQIVQDNNFLSLLTKQFDGHAANITGASRDKNSPN